MGRYIKSSATTTVKDEASGSITIPSGDTSERSPDPSSGDIRYNTETSALEFYNGTQFENVALIVIIKLGSAKSNYHNIKTNNLVNIGLKPMVENSNCLSLNIFYIIQAGYFWTLVGMAV